MNVLRLVSSSSELKSYACQRAWQYWSICCFYCISSLDKCDPPPPSQLSGLSTENTNNQQSGLKHLSNKFEATLSFFKVCLTFYFMNIAKTSFENFKYILIFRRIARTSLNDDNGHNSCLYWEKKTMSQYWEFQCSPNVTLLIHCPLFESGQWPSLYLYSASKCCCSASFPFSPLSQMASSGWQRGN